MAGLNLDISFYTALINGFEGVIDGYYKSGKFNKLTPEQQTQETNRITQLHQTFTQTMLQTNSNQRDILSLVFLAGLSTTIQKITPPQQSTTDTTAASEENPNPAKTTVKENPSDAADKAQEPNPPAFKPVNVDLVDRRELVDLVGVYLEQAQNHLIQKTPHTEFTHQEIKTSAEQIKQDLTVLVCNRAAFRVLLNVFEAGAWHKDKQTQQQQTAQQQKETQTNTTPKPASAKKKEVIPIE